MAKSQPVSIRPRDDSEDEEVDDYDESDQQDVSDQAESDNENDDVQMEATVAYSLSSTLMTYFLSSSHYPLH